MPDWLSSYVPEGWTEWQVAAAGTAFAILSAFVSVLIVGAVLARLPADFFVNHVARGSNIRHPILRAGWIVLRNLFGYILILLGIVLSLPGVPGQGILTILMGVILIDFPGKYRVERWFISRRMVLAGVNRLRARLGREPLVLEEASTCDPCEPNVNHT